MSKAYNKGQSMLEYAILLAVVIAALVIMQMIIKRGYQGGLQDSSSKMGDQFSPSSTTTKTTRKMPITVDGADNTQYIVEEQATTTLIDTFKEPVTFAKPTKAVFDKSVLGYVGRDGGAQDLETLSSTAGAKDEAVRVGDYAQIPAEDQVDATDYAPEVAPLIP